MGMAHDSDVLIRTSGASHISKFTNCIPQRHINIVSLFWFTTLGMGSVEFPATISSSGEGKAVVNSLLLLVVYMNLTVFFLRSVVTIIQHC